MKRVFALLLAAALCAGLLAGCGKAKEGTVKSGLFYDASGISPDTVLLTVDGRDVTADRYFYWLTDACDSMRARCCSYQPPARNRASTYCSVAGTVQA